MGKLPRHKRDGGVYTFLSERKTPTWLELSGDISDILQARCSQDDVYLKSFLGNEYSIGLGALGESIHECLKVMGEMVSLKGIITWLPIGNPDTPDFLIVREGKQKITGYFLFDVTLKGKFNQLVTLTAFLKNVANKNWQWIEDISQNKPKYRDVTALVVGVGVDLESDLSYYDYDALNSLFLFASFKYQNTDTAPS